MNRLYLTMAVCVLALPFTAFRETLACPPHGGTLISHACYVFAHAGLLHWAVNTWTFLVLHNVIRWHRLLAAYVVAVAISFLPLCHVTVIYSGGIHFEQRPVLGASVITAFFLGLIIRYLYVTRRTAAKMSVLLLITGLFIPGIAAVHHIVPFLFGMLYRKIEQSVMSVRSFMSSPPNSAK